MIASPCGWSGPAGPSASGRSIGLCRDTGISNRGPPSRPGWRRCTAAGRRRRRSRRSSIGRGSGRRSGRPGSRPGWSGGCCTSWACGRASRAHRRPPRSCPRTSGGCTTWPGRWASRRTRCTAGGGRAGSGLASSAAGGGRGRCGRTGPNWTACGQLRECPRTWPYRERWPDLRVPGPRPGRPRRSRPGCPPGRDRCITQLSPWRVLYQAHRELAALGVGTSVSARMTNDTGPGNSAPRTCPGSASPWQPVPAQGGEEQQGQEYRDTPPLGGMEERLSIECTGPNPREFWCVSPGTAPLN